MTNEFGHAHRLLAEKHKLAIPEEKNNDAKYQVRRPSDEDVIVQKMVAPKVDQKPFSFVKTKVLSID